LEQHKHQKDVARARESPLSNGSVRHRQRGGQGGEQIPRDEKKGGKVDDEIGEEDGEAHEQLGGRGLDATRIEESDGRGLDLLSAGEKKKGQIKKHDGLFFFLCRVLIFYIWGLTLCRGDSYDKR